MIRDFETKDIDEVVTVWRAATQVAHPFLADDFVEQEAQNLRNVYLVHAATRVLEKDGQVVGFIAMIGNEIGGLFLDPALHGNGLGRGLVDDAARKLGSLEVEVFARNAVGRRFYDGYGFHPVGSSTHEAAGETVLRLACQAAKEEAVV